MNNVKVIVTDKEQIDSYKENKALNQSVLKNIQYGINYFTKKLEEQQDIISQWAKIGSAVDCIITKGEEAFQDEYYVSQLTKMPSDTEIQIINSVLNQVNTFNSNDDSELKELNKYSLYILAALNEFNYQSRWKDDTRINKILENCTEYWEELRLASHKTILTKEESEIIRSAINRIQASPIFDDIYKDADEVYFQYPIYFEYKNIACKGLCDIVKIKFDEEAKIITAKIYDLKTTSSPLIQFNKSIEKFRYDIQAQFYIYGLKQHLKTIYSDYNIIIEPFSFIVVSITDESLACKFTLSDEYYANLYQNDDFSTVFEMLDLYKYHFIDTKQVTDDMIIVKSNYDVTL